MLFLLRWVLFRVEFGAGLIKVRGDECWRRLTCLYFHHETQPMPGPLSWFFHHLPKPLHRAEAAANHMTQLVVPFLLFAPQPVASAAAALMIVTQLWLVLSGNFAWLNWITIVLALPAVAWPSDPPPVDDAPLWYVVVVLAVSALLLALSHAPVRNMLSRRQVMNRSFDPLHLVNTYGAFGTVGRVRHEVVLEGTADEVPREDSDWREYEFKGKPGDPKRWPRQYAPYHLRLDWLMWFAALSPLTRAPGSGAWWSGCSRTTPTPSACSAAPLPRGRPAPPHPRPSVPLPLHHLAGTARDGRLLGADVRPRVPAADPAGGERAEVLDVHSRPVARSSSHRASGTGSSKRSAQSSTSAAERAPTSTPATAGWAAQWARAAARSEVPCRAAASLMRRARSRRAAGAAA